MSGTAKSNVELGNLLADFSFDALEAQFMRDGDAGGLMEHPEDLGKVRCGDHPGSVWHVERVKAILALHGVSWGALAQSDFGAPYPKPTRLLGHLLGLHNLVHVGAPSFDKDGFYAGPLLDKPRPPAMKVGKVAGTNDKFNTESTAAYPPLMCEAIAKDIVEHFHILDGRS